jgi:hypothetical protein
VRLLRANVIAGCFNASVAAGFDLDVRDVSYLVCQRRFGLEENSRDMVICLRRMNVLGRTHFLTDSCMSGRNASSAHALAVLAIAVACMWSISLT